MTGIVLAALAGCGGAKMEALSDEEGKHGAAPNFAEVLKAPRVEIAKRGDDVLVEVRTREQARRRGSLKQPLLPGWWQPLTTPGVHDAKFHPDLGISLPAYANPKEVTGDKELALQYARFGDVEAAVKIAGESAKVELEAFKLEQNFPIEWSRLAALYLHGLQQRLATGDSAALTELIDAHQQLATLLVGKLKTSPLGRDLLSRGRHALASAAKAWNEKGQPSLAQTSLAQQAEAALKDWPDEPPTLPLKGDKAAWSRALRSTSQGPVLVAASAARGLDLLQLPLPREGLDGLLLFFDAKDQLLNVLVTFTPGVRREAELAAQVAAGFNVWATPTVAGKHGPVVHEWDAGKFETCLCPVNETFGGWVSVAVQKDAAPLVVPRQLTQAHLDRRFETNRLGLAPQLLADPVTVADEAGLVRIENPLPAAKLVRAEYRRVEGHDLLHEAVYRFQTSQPLHQIAGPLFAKLGLGKLATEADQKRTYLVLTWEDAATQLILRVPDDTRESTELTLRDRRDATKSAERAAAVAAFEKAERERRLAAGKPLQRLPRKVEQFPLGMPKSEVLKFLPQGRGAVQRDLGDVLLVARNVPIPAEQAFLVRQVVLRFDQDKKVNWVRVRYDAGGFGLKQPNWPQSILAPWRVAGGTVASGPSPHVPWQTDLPPQAAAGQLYEWQDDLSAATCLLDSNGVEVTLWQRPAKDEAPSPFVYLPRGPEGLRLGMTLSEVKATLGEFETLRDGGLVFRPSKGPFDAIVVWTANEQIERIAGRYRIGSTAKTTPVELEKALVTQWATELATVGWPHRRDFLGKSLQALTWFDEQTRYRLYWAESENSPARLWSEWRGEKGK